MGYVGRMSSSNITGEWFESAFSHDYVRIYAHRGPEEAQQYIQALLKFVDIPDDAAVLDLCCGFGRHLEFLCRQGLNAFGCDLSLDLLSLSNPNLGARVSRADMRALPYLDQTFGQVFSFFTSFGYFEQDDENGRVIHEIARVLQPGGGVILDFLNPHHVRANLVPEDLQEIDGLEVRQLRRIDDETNTVNKELIVTEGTEERRYYERVKLYEEDHFRAFFDAAGLRLRHVLGNPDGTVYAADSKRMIMIGTKP